MNIDVLRGLRMELVGLKQPARRSVVPSNAAEDAAGLIGEKLDRAFFLTRTHFVRVLFAGKGGAPSPRRFRRPWKR